MKGRLRVKGAGGGRWHLWRARLLVLERGSGAVLVCCLMLHAGTGILEFSLFLSSSQEG